MVKIARTAARVWNIAEWRSARITDIHFSNCVREKAVDVCHAGDMEEERTGVGGK